MTHAARTHDIIDRLQRMRDDIDARIRDEEERAEKLQAELGRYDATLLLADALAALRTVNTRNLSEGQRQQIAGVKERLRRAIA